MTTKIEAIVSLRPGCSCRVIGETIEWLDEVQTEPTEAEIQAEIARLTAEQPWKDLRTRRNQLIAETDWIITMHKEKGTNIPAAWKTYRQALRDLPANTEDPANPVWPTKPE